MYFIFKVDVIYIYYIHTYIFIYKIAPNWKHCLLTYKCINIIYCINIEMHHSAIRCEHIIFVEF